MYHYGWVKNPYRQQVKVQNFGKLWRPDEDKTPQAEPFDYSKVSSLRLFDGLHPKVMQARVADMDWDFEFDTSQRRLPLKYRVLDFVERLTGKRFFEFRNYRLV